MNKSALLLALIVAGCCGEEGPAQDLGVASKVNIKMGSFNSCDLTVITTDTNVLTFCGRFPNIPLQRHVWLTRDACYSTYRFEGTDKYIRTQGGQR